MSTRTRPPERAATRAEPRAPSARPQDDELNEQITALLRQAAEARERQLALSLEDDEAGLRARAALHALVDRVAGTRKA
jgi:DNA-binding IclR family transcriptional regulator